MVEIIYDPWVLCEIVKGDGLLGTLIIGVPDEKQNKQYLRVSPSEIERSMKKRHICKSES